MSNILVTGATGFIGRNLVERLVGDGYRVTCLIRREAPPSLRSFDVVGHLGNMSDPESLRAAVAGQDVVFHLAGMVAALRKSELDRVNVEGTRNLAAACAGVSNPPVLVYVSSLAAAGPVIAGRPRIESDPPAPVSDYGRSKHRAELAAREFADRVPITIIRPGIVFGPYDAALLIAFRSPYYFRFHASPRRGNARYSLIHVAELIEVLLGAARDGDRISVEELQASGTEADPRGLYFASCGTDPTYRELGRMMGRELGRKVTVPISSPMPMVWAASAMNSLLARLKGKPTYFGLDKAREIAAGSWQCSPERARHDLSFQPVVPLAQRIRETGEWYLEHGWL